MKEETLVTLVVHRPPHQREGLPDIKKGIRYRGKVYAHGEEIEMTPGEASNYIQARHGYLKGDEKREAEAEADNAKTKTKRGRPKKEE